MVLEGTRCNRASWPRSSHRSWCSSSLGDFGVERLDTQQHGGIAAGADNHPIEDEAVPREGAPNRNPGFLEQPGT
jgi:hypothetical protein